MAKERIDTSDYDWEIKGDRLLVYEYGKHYSRLTVFDAYTYDELRESIGPTKYINQVDKINTDKELLGNIGMRK